MGAFVVGCYLNSSTSTRISSLAFNSYRGRWILGEGPNKWIEGEGKEEKEKIGKEKNIFK